MARIDSLISAEFENGSDNRGNTVAFSTEKVSFQFRCGFALLWLNSFSLDPDDRATRACHRFVGAFFRHSGYFRFGSLTLQMRGATTKLLAGFCNI
jgi:hypothetical protein